MVDAKNKETRTLRDIMRVVFRRKFQFFGAASFFALAVLIGSHWIGLKYTGTTKFTLYSDPAAKTVQSPGNDSLDAAKETLKPDLLSQQALEKVIRDLGLEKGMPHNAQGELTREGQQAQQGLVEAMKKDADLSWDVKSPNKDLLSLSVTNTDPVLARQIPNELVKNYIEKTSEDITKRLADSNSFLQTQVIACSARLSELQKNRIEFEKQYARQMPESPGIVRKRIDDLGKDMENLSRDMLTAQDKLREATAKVVKLTELFPHAADSLPAQDANQVKILVASYRKSRPTSGPATELASVAASQPATQPATQPAEEEPIQIIKGPNPERTRLEQQLRDREQELVTEQTIRHRTDQHPTILALKARIDQLKKQVEDTPAEVVTQKVYRNLANQLNAPVLPATDPLGIYTMASALGDWNLAALEDKRLNDDYADKKSRHEEGVALMDNFAVVRQRWVEYNNKVAECQAELTVWQNRRNDIQIALAAEVAKKRTRMDTLQAAQEQFLPSYPKLGFILGAAMFAALAGGAGLVLLLNLLDRTISTPDKAAELFNLPVHGVIGEIVLARELWIRRIKRCTVSPAIYLVVLICVVAAAVSITLRLQFPEMYSQWRADPLAFLYDKGSVVAGMIIDSIKSL